MMRPLLIACTVLLVGVAQDRQKPSQDAAQSQPATRPADESSMLRTPEQAETLRNLLGRRERPRPIQPKVMADGGSGEETLGVDPEGNPLLVDGAFLVERPGRLIHEAGKPIFVFQAEQASPRTRRVELLPNQLLEKMEREQEAGFGEFIISGEVTRYEGRNYLLLRKVLRRVGQGNLAP